ncbi:tetratricopeptide repeat protein [Polymorphobacter sp.]|uniref:tetratricopeptide repeat protein n=1 Tax=Polymorphobacter sp. TaxID=1909290 RepID=UPI003F7043EC
MTAAPSATVVAGPASTSMVSIIGSSRARACYDAAKARQPDHAALQACNRALDGEALTPAEQAATFVNRGIIHMQMRALAPAIADFDAAIAVRPGTAEAWVNKGIALIRSGDDAAGASLLTRGLELGPENPAAAHYSRAYAYEGMGRLREAYEDYGRAAALAPDWPEPGEQLRRFKVVRVRTAGA